MNWANDRYPAKALSFFLIIWLVEPPIRYIRTTVHAGLFGFVPGFLLGTLGAVAIALLVRRFPGATVLEIGRATLGGSWGRWWRAGTWRTTCWWGHSPSGSLWRRNTACSCSARRNG